MLITKSLCSRLVILAFVFMFQWTAMAESIHLVDFTDPAVVSSWKPLHQIESIQSSPEGMVVVPAGEDPYLAGPLFSFTPDQPLWIKLRLKTETSASCQIFYASETEPTSEDRSVRFVVPAGDWYEVRLPLPPMYPQTRFRIDPASVGRTIISSLAFENRRVFHLPEFPVPPAPTLEGAEVHSIQCGDLELLHTGRSQEEFLLKVAGESYATGLTETLVGYQVDGEAHWFKIGVNQEQSVATQGAQNSFNIKSTCKDPDGATWVIQSNWRAVPEGLSRIDVDVQISVDQDRQVLFLPMFAVLPGVGSFGKSKNQGLFAGLEYLEDEPSSSELDVIGPASRRQVPDNLKITFPLMTVQAKDRYLSLSWEMNPSFSAMYDSPDRFFDSGGHVMGILFPGSDGTNREEGNLLPYEGEWLRADQVLHLKVRLMGGKGNNVVPAIQDYVRNFGVPKVPTPSSDYPAFIRQMSAGFLDSKIKKDDRYIHSYMTGKEEYHPIAEAAAWMDWLASQVEDPTLVQTLTDQSQRTLALLPPDLYPVSGISHVFYPTAALLYGNPAVSIERSLQSGRDMVGWFQKDGTILYRPTPGSIGGLDYAKTHFAQHANGLTASRLVLLFKQAHLNGDVHLLDESIRLIRQLDRYKGTIPRGAQSWEVPLHTPDILASAYLVWLYVQAFELTSDPVFLDEAKYWAWTGVPFVYLVPPTDRPIGVYATIPVFGATGWVAPVWMGLPVQWCGLVYSEALYRLLRYDSSGPWKELADGITVVGMEMSWPLADPSGKQGLLPDVFHLKMQLRDGPAINPGTVLANAFYYFGKPPFYSFEGFHKSRLLLHAPGTITSLEDTATQTRFVVDGWPRSPYYLLISRMPKEPRILINGSPVTIANGHYWNASTGILGLKLSGRAEIDLSW